MNNRVLRALRWIKVQGNRDSPGNSEAALQDEAVLQEMWRDLRAFRKEPALFIGLVFDSRDPIWVERCASIISESEE